MKILIRPLIFALLLVATGSTFAQVAPLQMPEQAVAFTEANVLTMEVSEPIMNATILVENGIIVAIQPAQATIPDRFKVIELSGKWVMPGFIDGHVHLNQSSSAFTRPDIIEANNIHAYADEQAWLKSHLSELLAGYTHMGVTTIVDLGGPSSWLSQYATSMKLHSSPVIYAAAELIAPMPVPQLDEDGRVFLPATTAAEALAAVEMQLGLPTDVVKFVWTNESGMKPEALADIYASAMKRASDAGKVVAVHAQDLDYAKAAILSGADILVHGVMTSLIDDEFIRLAKAHQVAYMPTLTAHGHYKDIFLQRLVFTDEQALKVPEHVVESFVQLKSGLKDTGQMYQFFVKYMPYVDDPEAAGTLSQQEKAIVSQLSQLFSDTITDIQNKNLRKAADAGLRLAFGTDSGNPGTLHGWSVSEEMQAWMNAGIPRERLLKAMTLDTARAYNMDRRLGSLTSGKQASFIVFDNSPLILGIADLRPDMVVKLGQVIEVQEAKP